jgi:hypothetical protein
MKAEAVVELRMTRGPRDTTAGKLSTLVIRVEVERHDR